MNQGQIAQLLTSGNEWWRRPSAWERTDRDIRRIRESGIDYDPRPLDGLLEGGLYILSGLRRVGKSVAVKRRIAELISDGVNPRRIIHFSCDELDRGDLQRLVKVARDTLTRSIAEPRYWFLDEVTSVRGWPEAVKWLRDNTAFDEDCVVLTGSTVRDLEEARNQLAGRRGPAVDSDRLLRPMDFRAFCTCIGLDVPDLPRVHPAQFLEPATSALLDELAPWLDDLGSAWELYLTVGGFPRAVADYLAHTAVSDSFIGGLWDVIHGDSFRRANLSPNQTRALLLRLVKNVSSTTSLTTLAEDAGLGSHHTADERLKDLIHTHFVWPCHQEGDHRAPKLNAQTKFYFADPLIARLVHLRWPELPAPNSAQLTEQQIGQALLRALQKPVAGESEYTEVMYRRTRSKEVDFVGPAMGQLGFEGKYVDDGYRQEALTIRSQFGRGVLATRTLLDIDDEVWAVPAAFVAYLLSA